MANAIKKTAAIALAAGLSFAGSAGFAAQDAFAQDPATPVVHEQGSNFSLTVQKREGAWKQNDNYEGGELATPPGEALAAGFKFKIEQVTPAADDINNASKATPVQGGATKEGETDASGSIKFDNLPEGVYRVTETGVPEGSNYVPGPAFLVTVPVTKKDGTGVINDVVVYPKNTETTVEKSVKDADKNSGDTVEYTISANAPVVPEGNVLTSFEVQDAFKKSELTGVKVTKVEVDGVALDASSDYKVVDGEITDGPADADTTKTVEFTEAGLQKISKQQGAKVKVYLTATLEQVGDGEVVNNARTIVRGPNSKSTDEPKETPWDEVKTYLGKLRLLKTDGGEQKLAGATFDLFRCDADGNKQGDAIETGVVSGQDGLVNFNKSLHVTDYEDDAEVAEVTKRYCAVETKAPEGYQKLSKPIVIEFTRADRTENLTVGDVTYEKVQKTETVVNTKPLLPSTGGMGILIVALAGLAIIGGGAYAARRNSQSA
ncbi:SpaH/EbpB family LPXTG-anchored major pilin [Corynebacterium sp. 20_84]